MTAPNIRRLATIAMIGAAFAQSADAGLFAKLKAKFSCHKKPSCCEPVCCEPEPACDPCAAPVLEDCGCGGETVIVSEGAVIEASPSEEPTPADAAPEPPAPEAPKPMTEKEGASATEAMSDKEKRIAAMKAEAAAIVKKAAAEGK